MTELARVPEPVAGAASMEELAKSIGLAKDLGLLVVGSVGRTVIFNRVGDPLREYGERGEDPLLSPQTRTQHDGRTGTVMEPRDADVCGWSVTDPRAYKLVHKLDDMPFFTNYRHQVYKMDGTWKVVVNAPESGVQRRIDADPKIFIPYIGLAMGSIPCVTVGPATHYALLASSQPRAKEKLAQRLLWEVMTPEERAELDTGPYQEVIEMLKLA